LNFALQATRFTFPRLATFTVRQAHLIGVAGAGMQAMAEVMLARGWKVNGSDLDPQRAGWLWPSGVRAFRGHSADHISDDIDLVVYSDAVGPENVERRRAAELGIKQLSYPMMLGELMQGRIGLAVAGTHGKSTTTALTEAILMAADLDPTVVAGGTPLGRDSGGRRGRGRHVLVEACEYRHNFLHLSPKAAVLLGIEHDHFDCFATLDEVEAAYAQFANRLPANGVLLADAGCPATIRIARQSGRRVVTFGLDPAADWHAAEISSEGGRYSFQLFASGRAVGSIALRIAGRHQVVNALAAAALASQAGADDEAVVAGLNSFRGLRRRLERVGPWHGALWLDDYAHHPTAVRATLATVREMFPSRRLWCIFQPHQASRTRRLLDEFAASLQNADRVAIAEVVAAREPRLPADDGLADELDCRTRSLGATVLVGRELGEIGRAVAGEIAHGDVVLTLGAGDIRNVWHAAAGRIRANRAA
jgi:UDP-N-acetylmuramate--alanine ligase